MGLVASGNPGRAIVVTARFDTVSTTVTCGKRLLAVPEAVPVQVLLVVFAVWKQVVGHDAVPLKTAEIV